MTIMCASTCGHVPTEEVFAAYRDAGVDAMEISLKAPQYDELDLAEVSRLADEYGIRLHSLHLPFKTSAVNIAEPSLAEASVARHADLICRGAAAGIRLFVVHPSGEPISPEQRPVQMAQAKNSLKLLAEIAAEHGAVIAVEDLPRTCLGNCSAEILELLSAHPALRVCFDTNHLLSEDPVAFVRAVGSAIVTLHVSDYDFTDEKHWVPGTGLLDWPSLIAALKEVGYDGVWTTEVGFELTSGGDLPTLHDIMTAADPQKLAR